jgi:DNA-binding CsgD family transcriptional regulator
MSKYEDPIESILGISFTEAKKRISDLTEREVQVAELLAGGKRTREIAETLGISKYTAVAHRNSVHAKLRAESAVDVARVVFAKKFGDCLRG